MKWDGRWAMKWENKFDFIINYVWVTEKDCELLYPPSNTYFTRLTTVN